MPTKLVVDCSTGVTTEVELTAEEVAEREVRQAEYLALKEQELLAAQAKAEAKASALVKLAALGLTEEEAAAIAGA
jgi:hypothetical protein